MKVQKKLPLLMILVVVIPLLILSAVVNYFASVSALNTKQKALADSSASIAGYFSSYFITQRGNMEYSAEIPLYAQRLSDPENPDYSAPCNQLLDITVNTNATLTDSQLVDASGKVLNCVNTQTTGQNLSDTAMYRQIVMEGVPYYCDVSLLENGAKELAMAVPVHNGQNQLIGMLTRSVSLESIYQSINQQDTTEHTAISIIDTDAHPLSATDHAETFVGDNFGAPRDLDASFQKFLADIENNRLSSDEGFFAYTADGQERLAHYTYLADAGWVIVASVSKSEIYGNVADIQRILILTTLCIALLSLLLGLRVSKTVTQPLTYLTQKIHAIGEENFSVRCELPGNDEFHKLAVSINKMAASLETSRHELIRTNDLLKKSARIDPLTSLPNRKAIYYTLDHLFRRHNNQALLLLDINGLKTINDTFGHHMGDAVLIAVADILKASASDTIHPARLSSDEFLIFISNYATPHDVLFMADTLLGSIQNIKSLKNQPIDLSGSMGIVFLKDNGISRTDWMLQADDALRAAKASPDSYRIYKARSENHSL